MAQLGFGIDGVEFAGLDQAVDGCGAQAASVGASEEPVLSAECHAPQGALGSAVVDLEPSIVGKRWSEVT